MQINPHNLKLAREAKPFSLDELAHKSAIDRSTIHRIETDTPRNRRAHTINALAKALGISTDQLCGPDLDEDIFAHRESRQISKSQMNVRIPDHIRNAFYLAALRYGIRPNYIVQIAPYLFVWAAEMSLKKRQEALGHLVEAQDRLQSEVPGYLGGSFYADFSAFDLERVSIEKGDIFGEEFVGTLFDPQDPTPSKPFDEFLKSLLSDMPAETSLEEEYDLDVPNYEICHANALDLVGGDANAADHIICGRVAIHEVPDDVIQGDAQGRALWINEVGDQRRAEFLAKFPGVKIDLNLSDDDHTKGERS